jgi:hypothetical protein
MRRGLVKTLGSLVVVGLALDCVRTRAVDSSPSPGPTTASTPFDAAPEDASSPSDGALADTKMVADATAEVVEPWSPPPATAIDGPHEELTLDAGRPVYYALSRGSSDGSRLVGHLHGMCTPPPYSCGRWIGAGTEVGIVICPTGNARCGDSPVGPASWEAPTWTELVTQMDADLETAVAKVSTKRPGKVRREGAILTGYSRGGYAVPSIARRHPGRWPYLVLIESDATLTAASLTASGVRAVALVAGEWGNQLSGMEKTQQALAADGFPAKLFVMRRTSHPYSDDMESVMHEAFRFVLSQPLHQEAPDASRQTPLSP